ncbi:hypothetical protein L5515_018146 [Caenorhabditis briggsae]|uniref:Uncharacterized protein n=1 Tax=Caenorhabditis briggsae TaxID=6238 RepID=A0AAE9FIM1_CAEBR|nr:hypothetical protein L5515_018146 [Caenorhabditis briggsae]
MRFAALFVVLGYLGHGDAQYQQSVQGGQQSGYQQGGYQSGGSQSRYQQSHVVVGPGPVIGGGGGANFGGQFKEQRTINIQENIQGVQQGGGYGYGASGGYQSQYGSRYGYGQQGQQNGFGGQMGAPGRTVFSNNPMNLDTGNGLMGAEVDLRLISYSNSGLKLPNGTTCNCPISNCNYVPSNHQNQCQFSFVLVISCADQSIQYTQSNFYPVPNNGIMTTGNWTDQHTFYMTTKPVSIDVFVQHLGVVIDSSSGQLLFFNHLALVDSFVVDLSKFSTSTGNAQGSQTLTLVGTTMSTQLQMNLNVQCINNFMGPLCDLTCNSTNAQAGQLVACYSNRTDTFSLCKWNTQRTQVVECKVCTYGVYNGACSAAVNVNNVGVAYAFRTWTIVLGCLLGIALLLILCLILAYLICFRILNRSYEKEGREDHYKYEENTTRIETNDDKKSNNRKSSTQFDHGSNEPLITNEEWTSTTVRKQPVGILSKRNEDHAQEQVHNHQIQNQNRQTSTHQQNGGNVHRNGSADYGQRQIDSPSTEDSYTANGQVQHTTTTTTTTTRREHIV